MGQATYVQDGRSIDYTPTADVAAGAVVVLGKTVGMTNRSLAAGEKGSLCVGGVHDIVKINSAFQAGEEVYWNSSGDPYGGTAGSGAATTVAEGNVFVGFAIADAAAADATVRVRCAASRASGKLYTALAASAAIANTADETEFNKSVTLPASSLKAGDVLRIRGQVIATATNGADTLTVKLKIGNTVIAATPAVDVANNDIALIDQTVVIRADGAGGKLIAAGMQSLGPAASATMKPTNLAETAVDTTATQKIAMTATWSAANAGNSCRLDVLTVEKLAA